MNTLKLKLNLLENAIDSLEEGVRKYLEWEKGNKKDLKFSVLNIAHFIELFLKYYVSEQHLLLIYNKPCERITNESKTISLDQAIQILENCEVKIGKSIVSDAKKLKLLRNKIEHYEFELNINETQELIGKLIYDLIIFDKKHLDIKLNEHLPSALWSTLDHLSKAYELKVESAISEAGKTGREIFICYSCGNNTQVVSEDGEKAICVYCDNWQIMGECCLDCGKTFPISHMRMWNEEYSHFICEYCNEQFIDDRFMKDD